MKNQLRRAPLWSWIGPSGALLGLLGCSSSGATLGSGGATGSSGAPSGMAGSSAGATSTAGATSGAGTTSGGATSGGATGSAGTTSGGATGGGATGSAGMTASAGAAGRAGGTAVPSTGCGAASHPPGDGTTLQTIDVAGVARQYIVALPPAYVSSTPYRLVFAWHGRTGTAQQIAGGRNAFYGLKSRIGDSTILVTGQGLGTEADPADTGWPNTNGRDVAFVRALITSLSQSYCVDQSRIMSTGMSYGGIMSNTLGCQASELFRAIAPIAGAVFGRNSCTGGQHVAAWMTHGTADDQVTFASGEAARDAFLAKNGCGTTTQAVEPAGCVSYDGCDAGYPVIFCTHDGGHIVPAFSADAIANFFRQF